MVISSAPQRVSTVGTLALTALSFAPLRATLAQEDGASGEPSRSSASAPLDNSSTSPSILDAQGSSAKLPDRIVGLALERGVSLEDVKLEGNQWVACVAGACQLLTKALPEEIAVIRKERTIDGLHIGERLLITGHSLLEHTVEGETSYGIPGLGSFNRQADGSITFQASPDFKGTVAKATIVSEEQSTSRAVVHGMYSSTLLREIGDSIASQPDTSFVVVVSVPGLCGPCRQYVSDINVAAATLPESSTVKFFVVNFDSFENARRIMGKIKAFPATVIFPSVQSDKGKGEQNAATSLFLSTIDRPGYQFHGRVDSLKLRGAIKGAERKVTRSSEGISQTTVESLTQDR